MWPRVLVLTLLGLLLGCEQAGSLGAPGNFRAVSSPAPSVLLSWTAVPEARFYALQRREGDAGEFADLALQPEVGFTDATVQSGRSYAYRLKAVGLEGNSGWVETTTLTPPGRPNSFRGSATSSTSIALAWDAVPGAPGYALERAEGGGAFQPLTTQGQTAFTDAAVQGNRTYTYRLRAANAGGSSGTVEVGVSTLNPPAALNITGSSAGNVALSWEAVAGAGDYVLERRVGTGAWEGLIPSQTATAYNDTAVVAGTTYTYRVFARNATGRSSPRDSSPVTTPGQPQRPGRPTGVSAAASGSALSVAVSWTAPSPNTAESYVVQRRTGAGSFAQIAANVRGTAFTDTSVAAGTQYAYRVIARNGAGDSDPSDPSNTATALATPPNPASLSAVPASPTGVSLSWSAVSGATSYTLERGDGPSPGGWTTVSSSLTGTSTTNGGLTTGNTYTYRIRAANAAGQSTAAPTAATVSLTPPADPASLSATPASATGASLSWAAVAGATGYTLERGLGASPASWTALTLPSPTATSFSDTGLSAGATYTYRVRAGNAVGTSSPGRTATLTTAVTEAPGNPTNLRITVSNNSAFLSWAPPASGGPVGEYRIERGGSQVGTAPAGATAFTNGGLSASTAYTYRVRAANAAGVSSGVELSVTTVGAAGFRLEVAARLGGNVMPWSINFAPDGRLFFTTRDLSQVRVSALNLSTGAVTNFGSSAAVRDEGEAGVLGMELDPGFASNGRVYVCYSTSSGGSPRNRLSRFEVSGGSLANELVLFDNMPGAFTHNGCRVVWGPDNRLYFSMGDAENQGGAQDPSVLSGKILRINPDGSIPSDNPFFGSLSGQARAVWSTGHRNPQGLGFQPGTGALWSTEHGANTRDELNVVRSSRNYGWPLCIGTQAFGVTLNSGADGTRECTGPNLTSANYQPAVREYAGGDLATVAPSDLTFYPSGATAFPAWQGNLFFVTLKTGRLYRLELSGETVNNGSGQILLDNQYGRLRDVTVGPDGFIYISTDSGQILRLTPDN